MMVCGHARSHLLSSPGDYTGWLYTIWGFIMTIGGALILLVMTMGKGWRERAEEREAHAMQKEIMAP